MDSTYFRILFSAFLILFLFLTAVFIALESETRKKARQDYEKQVPDAEILLPSPEGSNFPVSKIDQETDPYFGFETDDWKDYSKTKQVVKFKIDFPENWVFESKSELINEKGEKIAEYGPGPVLLKPGQKCDDTLEITTPPSPETMPIESTEHVTIGNLEGIKTIYQEQPESVVTYGGTTTRYCLQESDKAFVILFYARTPNLPDEQLYNQILSTLRFDSGQ